MKCKVESTQRNKIRSGGLRRTKASNMEYPGKPNHQPFKQEFLQNNFVSHSAILCNIVGVWSSIFGWLKTNYKAWPFPAEAAKGWSNDFFSHRPYLISIHLGYILVVLSAPNTVFGRYFFHILDPKNLPKIFKIHSQKGLEHWQLHCGRGPRRLTPNPDLKKT